MESKNAKFIETESRMVVARVWGMMLKGYKLPAIRWISPGDYS